MAYIPDSVLEGVTRKDKENIICTQREGEGEGEGEREREREGERGGEREREGERGRGRGRGRGRVILFHLVDKPKSAKHMRYNLSTARTHPPTVFHIRSVQLSK